MWTDQSLPQPPATEQDASQTACIQGECIGCDRLLGSVLFLHVLHTEEEKFGGGNTFIKYSEELQQTPDSSFYLRESKELITLTNFFPTV